MVAVGNKDGFVEHQVGYTFEDALILYYPYPMCRAILQTERYHGLIIYNPAKMAEYPLPRITKKTKYLTKLGTAGLYQI